MTQQGTLFKWIKRKNTTPPSGHGERNVKPSKSTSEMDADRVPMVVRDPMHIPKIKILNGLPVYFLFECAYGYTLFRCDGLDEVGEAFELAEEYIKRYKEVFKFIAFYPFQSTDAALSQLSFLSESNPTKELIDFLMRNLPKPNPAGSGFWFSSDSCQLTCNISDTRIIPSVVAIEICNIVRGLRTNICELIGKEPAELEKLQRDLALSFSRQRCKSTLKQDSVVANSSSSFLDDEVVVVPHKFEGVFIAKGKNNDAICTKNLVPGEAVNGEELISVKNKDGIESEYRIWNPSSSKLAAAIQSGVTNIWVKPGSRVLYMGEVCGTTLSHLSDLVGHDGLVYAVGRLSHAAIDMAGKRSNVIPIHVVSYLGVGYAMLVSMVDVICADLKHNYVIGLIWNLISFLKAGGHFLVSTQAKNTGTVLSTIVGDRRRELDILEKIELEQFQKGLEMTVGCFRRVSK